MNKTQSKKKLSVQREAIRTLSRTELDLVAGGARNPTGQSCEPTGCCPSNISICH